MSKFDLAIEFVFRWEGGYSSDPADPGGETQFGISKRAHPTEDIAKLTRERARAIYHAEYWEPLGCDRLPGPVALAAFDYAVNAGVPRARAAVDSCRSEDPHQWARKLCYHRMAHYLHLGAATRYRTFLRGWMNRLLALLRELEPTTV